MKWIVITSPSAIEGEATHIARLIDAGVDVVHVRKPGWNVERCRRLLSEVPSEYRRDLVVHDNFELCGEYGLRGIHLNSRNHAVPDGHKGSVSRSCHSIVEALRASIMCEYVFLSPIFDSISKEGYLHGFTHTQLTAASADGNINDKTIALGGVTIGNIEYLRNLNFGGVAMLGDIWSRILTPDYADYLQRLRRIIKK